VLTRNEDVNSRVLVLGDEHISVIHLLRNWTFVWQLKWIGRLVEQLH
jgi:hypothetical protein